MKLLRGIQDRIRADARLSRILHGAVSALAGKGTALVVNAITLPLMVRYLGRVEYGIWVTISSTVIMLAVLDLGISSTLTNSIARANATDNREMAQQQFATAFFVTVSLAVVLGMLGYLVWARVAWGALLGVQDGLLAGEAARCVGISAGFFLLNLPLSLAGRVLSGYQQVQVANYFAMIGSTLGLIALVCGVRAHLTIVGLMGCFCLAMLAGNVCLNLWLWFRSRPWIRPRLSQVRVDLIRGLFGEGGRFFVLQLAGLVVFNSDNLVIVHFLGAGEVTPYSVAARMMSYAALLHSLLIPVLWPAFADAYHRGDLLWLRSVYRRVAMWTMAGVCGAAVVLALTGRWIIRVWATEAAVPSAALLWAMAAWAVILAASTNQACLLAATQRIGLQAVTSSVAAVCNFVASVYLVRTMGSLGVILATIGSYLVFVLVPQGWEVRHILRGRYWRAADAV